MASSSSTYSTPCAACKFLRRKCVSKCSFAPYFPPEEPQKFVNVHKFFGASNVAKLLNELLPHQREDAVNSLAYEAEARVQDPVYGIVGAISYLQRQVDRLQKELDIAHADLIRYACGEIYMSPSVCIPSLLPVTDIHNLTTPRSSIELMASTRRVINNQDMGRANIFQSPLYFPLPCNPHVWGENPNVSKGGGSL